MSSDINTIFINRIIERLSKMLAKLQAETPVLSKSEIMELDRITFYNHMKACAEIGEIENEILLLNKML